MFTLYDFLEDQNAMVSSDFIKIVSAVFEIFRKKDAKKNNTFFKHDYNT